MTTDPGFPRPLSGSHPDDDGPFAFYEAFNARDFEAMGAMYAPDVVFIDRRPGLTTTVTGRDAQMEQLRVMTDLGMYQSPNTVLANFEKRLFLLDVPWSNRDADAPLEVQTLLLLEYAENGRIKSLYVYEPADVADALLALKQRQAELER